MAASVTMGQAVMMNAPACFGNLKKNVDALPGCLPHSSFVGAGVESRMVIRVPLRLRQKLRRFPCVRNAASEVVEMEPASEGSQLLGESFFFWFGIRIVVFYSCCCSIIHDLLWLLLLLH